MNELRSGWGAVVAVFALNGVIPGVRASRMPAVAERDGPSPGGPGRMRPAIGPRAIASFPPAGRLADGRGAARALVISLFAHAFGPQGER